jgi:hypothetical protein
MRRPMECQRLGSSLGVYACEATSFVSLLEIVIFESLGQSTNCARELFDRFPPFLAQPILFGTVAHFLLIDRPIPNVSVVANKHCATYSPLGHRILREEQKLAGRPVAVRNRPENLISSPSI